MNSVHNQNVTNISEQSNYYVDDIDIPTSVLVNYKFIGNYDLYFLAPCHLIPNSTKFC